MDAISYIEKNNKVSLQSTRIGHKSLIFSSKSALDLLATPELLMEACEEQSWRTMGKAYRSPLPPDTQLPVGMFG